MLSRWLSANSIAESFLPLFYYMRWFGFISSAYKSQTQVFAMTALSLTHTVAIIIFDVFLLHQNSDPKLFESATNNTLLNMTLWIEVELSALIVIAFKVSNAIRNRSISNIIAKCKQLDKELRIHFSVYVPFSLYKRLALIITFALILISFAKTASTYSNLRQLPTLTSYQVYILCGTTCMTQVCFSIVAAQFTAACIFIYSRSRFVNLLLRQLLANEPLPTQYEIIASDQIDYSDFNYLRGDMPLREGRAKRRPSQQTVGLADNLPKVASRLGRRNSPNTPNAQLSIINRENYAKLWNPEIDKLISTFNIFDIRMLRQMIVTRLVFIDNSDSLYTARKLDQLYHIYANLMECLDMLNSSSTIQTYTTMMFTAVFILLGVYAKIRVYIDYQREADYASQIVLNSVSTNCALLFLPFYLASKAISEMKDVPKTISRIAYSTSDRIILSKLLEISRKLRARLPVVACGTLVFDGRIILSIIAAVAMYLIMLVQFYLSFDVINSIQSATNSTLKL